MSWTYTDTAGETIIRDGEALYTCAGCGAVTAPDGVCLEVGACERADAAATRGASRVTAKATVAPAAWNVRGGVD